MKCKQCNQELSGKKQYCNDACRMAYSRRQPEHQPEQNHQPEHEQIANPNTPYTMDATRTNPELINTGKPMTNHQLKQAGLKANRVPIPGDHDYKGVCEQVGGVWKVRSA